MDALKDVTCSLCRSYQQSVDVLERAKKRKVSWSQQSKQSTRNFEFEDSRIPSSLNEAFNGLYRTLSKTSSHCKSYYTGCDKRDNRDRLHCERYHTSAYRTATRTSLPGESSKSVHVDLQPGNYLVTAGNRETGAQESHMLHIQKGQTVNMNLVV